MDALSSDPRHGGAFVGREAELAVLRAAFEASRSGAGRVVFLLGEPGIGKTRLAKELAQQVHANANVLWGQCWDGEGVPALWPWIQALRPYVERCDAADLRDDLGTGAHSVAQVIPAVAERWPQLGAPPALQPEHERFHFFDSFTRFLKATARRRALLLVFDDLHWADAATLLLLQFVVREIQDTAMLIVAAYRETDVSPKHRLRNTLGNLVRVPRAQFLNLGRLTAAECGQYAEKAIGRAPPTALVDAIYRETGGNPFFLAAVVSLLHTNGSLNAQGDLLPQDVALPESVRVAVEHGLRLSPFAGQLELVGPATVADSLRRLAVVLQRWAEAESHVLRALRMHEHLGSQPLITRTRYADAVILLARNATGNREKAHKLLDAALATVEVLGMQPVAQQARAARGISEVRDPEPDILPVPERGVFHKNGDVWVIEYGDASCQLRDTRGLQYLATLLRHPGEELHATALARLARGEDHSRPSPAAGQPEGTSRKTLGDAGPVLDAQATAEYQRRLTELREALAEAEAHNDAGRTTRLGDELEFLARELAGAGRRRRSASHAERARLTVTKGIAAAMKKIAAAHPVLGKHLRATIRTGYFCRYLPDPRLRIEWLVGFVAVILSDDTVAGMLDAIQWLGDSAVAAFWG